MSDSNPQSVLEHETFTSMAKNVNICIQRSQLAADVSSDDEFKLKTDGVVVFANDFNSIKSIIEKIPKTSPVVIATHDRRTRELTFVHEGIVLSDAFVYNEQFTDFMTSVLWTQTTLDELSIKYYLSNHNCSFNNQSTPKSMSCKNKDEIRAYFSSFSSTRQMHTYHEAFSLITNIANNMLAQNCRNYKRSCLNETDVNKLPSYFSVGTNQTLVPKPPYNASVSLVVGGNVQKVINLLSRLLLL